MEKAIMTFEWDNEDDGEEEASDPKEEWECEFGVDCLMPSAVHLRSECYTLEMAEEWQMEQAEEIARASRRAIIEVVEDALGREMISDAYTAVHRLANAYIELKKQLEERG